MTREPAGTDASLVGRMGRKEQDALAALYDRHRVLLFTLALRILKSRADAEEVLAEVFQQAWRSAAGFDPARGSVEGWLLGLCRSRALERARARGRRGAREEEPAQPVEIGAEQRERREQVEQLLILLPPDQRGAIELAFYEGYSQAEIAEVLGEPIETVKTRIRQGLSALRANFSATFV